MTTRLAHLLHERDHTIALIGVAKNAGKTTALGVLADELRNQGETLGLVSVGIDGEATDAISGAAKPPVYVGPGDVVATADRALHQSGLAADILRTTAIRTPLGEVVVARARREGRVVLAGLRHRADVRAMRDALGDAGVTRVLIDGAFDRLAAADPDTSDAVILAAGLSGGSLDQCVRATTDRVAQLTLPAVGAAHESDHRSALPSAWQPVPDAAISARSPWQLGVNGWTSIAASSLLTWSDAPSAAPALAVFAPGVITESGLTRVERALAPDGVLVINDGTRVEFAAARALRRFRRHHPVFARQAIHLRAVTVNPTRSDGTRVPLAERLKLSVPVVDVRR